jgi:hypothetical protein
MFAEGWIAGPTSEMGQIKPEAPVWDNATGLETTF